MAVFYILLLFPMLIQHIKVRGSHLDYEKKNQGALLFFFAFLTVLIMLRHISVGSDTSNYKHLFEYFSRKSWTNVRKDTLEIGFSYFNKLVSVFTNNPQVFLSVTAVIVSALIYPTYKRLCVDTSLTVVLFCTMSTFVMMFSGIRQMLAVGIGFLAYGFTRKKKLIPFLLMTLLAMLFHISAAMLVFMYPLYHVKITRKWLIVIVPVIAAVFVGNKRIFSMLAVFVERFTRFDATMEQTGAYTMLFLFMVFAVFAFLIPDESLLDEEMLGLRNFLLFSLVLQMFAPLHTLAMRLNYYYIIFVPLLIPKIIECRSVRWNQVAFTARHIMVLFFTVYFFYNAISGMAVGGNLYVFPYHFFWETLS